MSLWVILGHSGIRRCGGSFYSCVLCGFLRISSFLCAGLRISVFVFVCESVAFVHWCASSLRVGSVHCGLCLSRMVFPVGNVNRAYGGGSYFYLVLLAVRFFGVPCRDASRLGAFRGLVGVLLICFWVISCCLVVSVCWWVVFSVPARIGLSAVRAFLFLLKAHVVGV